jgi:hypothetical protein
MPHPARTVAVQLENQQSIAAEDNVDPDYLWHMIASLHGAAERLCILVEPMTKSY